MLGLDRLFGVDAYSRNEAVLKEIGVQYTKQEHKRYLAWLVIKNAEEISLKQYLINQDAKNALALEDSETYSKWDNPRVPSRSDRAHFLNKEKVVHGNEKINKVLNVYVEALGEAVEENLSVDVESIYTEAVRHGTEYRQHVGESCEQTWRLKNNSNNKTALIL